MPDIITDGKRFKHRPYNIWLYFACDKQRYPYGKPIDPITDMDAQKTKDG
jgi:hypothetical protein